MASINRPHGIMFHHFHSDKHFPGQGSISAEQLDQLINYYQKDHTILNADEWAAKALKNTLSSNDVCLTFDDALLCQYDVALPVLEKHNITAFWFVYTSVIDGKLEMLEVYRKFRTIYFNTMNDFYEDFFQAVMNSAFSSDVSENLKSFNLKTYLAFSPFYTTEDRKFRFIRDICLGNSKYQTVMTQLMDKYSINIKEFSSDLWLNRKHLQQLVKDGHLVGLHSHSHPTRIGDMSVADQKSEFEENYKSLLEITGNKPIAMSHPCNSYNNDTLCILQELGIKLGFRADIEENFSSSWEFPREDHANVIRRLQ